MGLFLRNYLCFTFAFIIRFIFLITQHIENVYILAIKLKFKKYSSYGSFHSMFYKAMDKDKKYQYKGWQVKLGHLTNMDSNKAYSLLASIYKFFIFIRFHFSKLINYLLIILLTIQKTKPYSQLDKKVVKTSTETEGTRLYPMFPFSSKWKRLHANNTGTVIILNYSLPLQRYYCKFYHHNLFL